MLLPENPSEAEYEAIRKDDDRWRPAARAILDLCGISGDPIRLGGTAIVYAAGDRVLKLYAPMWRLSYDTERLSLRATAGRLGVATPEITADGSFEGWPYLVMTRLEGRPLDDAWAGMDRASREIAARRVGDLLGRLHALAPPTDPAFDPPGGWPAFLTERAGAVVERQRARGLPEADCARLESSLREILTTALGAAEARPALLHTEIGPSHVLVDDRGVPSGVLDFADALVGPPAYDLVAAGLFVTRGDPSLFAILAKEAGYSPDPAALWAFTVLHRYANLPWYLRETGRRDLADLATIYG